MKPTGATKDGALSVRNFDYHEYGDITINETNNGITVAIAYMQGRGPEVTQRAVEIITAVNERERLREALRQVRAMFFKHAQAGGYVEKGKLIHVDNKQHPWIPGVEAPRAIAIIDAALNEVEG